MSGTGEIGKEIAEKFPGNTLWYIDTSQAQLNTIADQEHVIAHDVRKGLPSTLPQLDGAVVRFGVKNLSQEDQKKFVSDVANKLVDRGWLVIADMVSPENMQDWRNNERRLKHKLEGHDVEKEGAGNIPYLIDWVALLENAGFDVDISEPFTSHVQTNKWHKQFAGSEDDKTRAVQDMNKLLLSASEEVKTAFNIHTENGTVQIDYPLRIFRAKKKVSIRR